MHSYSLIGILAIVTLVAFIVFAALHFSRHLRDPANRRANDAVKGDDSSAHTAVRGGSRPDHMGR